MATPSTLHHVGGERSATTPQKRGDQTSPLASQSAMTAGGDTPSAKQVVRDAARSAAGIIRLTTQTGTAAEKAALSLLAASSDVVSTADLFIYTAVGATPDGSPIWSELCTAIANS